MPLTFKCKHCDRSMYIMHLEIGEIAKCKDCGKKTTIPEDAKTISEFAIPEKDRESKKNKTKKSKIVDNKSKNNTSITNHSKNTEKYPALRFISALLKFISIASLVIACIIFVIMIGYTGEQEVFLAAIIPFIYLIIGAICIYAYAELITLFIDVEKNTRKSK